MYIHSYRGGLLAFAGGVGLGGVFGGFWGGKSAKKKYEKEKKDLVQYIQLQDEIYKKREAQWQAEYNKVYKAYNELEQESIERDYEEFKAPDVNGDDMITRAEFNTYVRKYLSSFPELSEKDFPVFEEFDLDGDGVVSFEEWQRFLQLQKQKEAREAQAGKSQGQYQDLLNALYDQSSGSNSFNNLNQRIEDDYRGKRGSRGR
jgi:Ca2+-binding EF-hand superfamily protein